MKKVFLCLLFAAFAAFPCRLNAQSVEVPEGTDTAFVEAVDKFMEVSGSRTTLKAQFPLIMNNLRKMLKVGFYAPFYERYYTLEDIKGLIAFYETDLGRKVARTNPSLSRDLFQAGEPLVLMVLQSVVEELKAEGYDVKDL